jgi:ribosomal protein S25
MADETTPNQETPEIVTPAEQNPAPEPVSTPEPTSEPQTAQFPPNEPLATEPEPIEEPEPKTETSSPAEVVSTPAVIEKPQSKIKEFLNNARFAIQTRKKKKMERIMNMFTKKSKITNDEVEKLLHISDATATRYLTILKKEGKIQQIGKTGKGVSYSKI